MRKFFITFFIALLATMGYSQRFLLLEKSGTFKNYKYFEGDEIAVKLHKDQRFISGTITRLDDSTFVVDNQESFGIGQVKSVVRQRFFFSFFGPGAMMGGGMYFTLDALNRAFSGEAPVVTAEAAIIGGSLVGAGWVMSLFKNKTYSVGTDKKWRLRMMTTAGN